MYDQRSCSELLQHGYGWFDHRSQFEVYVEMRVAAIRSTLDKEGFADMEGSARVKFRSSGGGCHGRQQPDNGKENR